MIAVTIPQNAVELDLSTTTITLAAPGPAGPAGPASSITVKEQDGTPTVNNVTEVRVTNATLTDEGGGAVSIAIGGGTEFADDVFRIQDDGDATKEIAFQASAITTGTTRTVTMPDSNVDLTPASGTFAAASHNHAASAITSGELAHERGGLEADVNAYDGYIRITGGATSNVKIKHDATAAPDADNDSTEDYVVGSRWIDTTNDKEYVCLDNTDTAAVWIETTQSGAGGGTEFADDVFRIQDDGDATKEIAFQASTITTGTTRTITMPDSNVDLTPASGTFAAASHNHDADYADIAHVHDAAAVTYTPAVNTDWDGDADPGDLDDALNQLAERVDDLEGAGGGGTAELATGTYTGDGNATQAITGVGFQPNAVIIHQQVNSVNPGAPMVSTDQDSGNTLLTSGTVNVASYLGDHVVSLDVGGFTVGDGTSSANRANVSARPYAYIALKG